MAEEEKKIIIQVENVGVSYRRSSNPFSKDKYWALKDISFDVYTGETLGIIGRNGAGKSTLLRLLAEIIEPDKGTIQFESGFRAALLALQVGFSGPLTGRQNIVMSGMLLGVKREVMLKGMDSIIDMSALGEFIEQPVRAYSSGMRARLGFAIAIFSDPDVILLDEVLGVGDAGFKKQSSQLIKEKIHSDKTVILVSHSHTTVRNLCDRAIWIEDGVVVDEGPAKLVAQAY